MGESNNSKQLNDKSFCFIICTNDDLWLQECIFYINQLSVPAGYTTDVISVREATSMAAGYNAAMQSSDAKYKIYLHQDVFILNRHFLQDILDLFAQDRSIGMVGVIGCEEDPLNASYYDHWNIGATKVCNGDDAFSIHPCGEASAIKAHYVSALDGMLMTTSVDIPWREDLFDGWDFYDASQAMEFRKAGYKLAVAAQNTPWCMHDCGNSKLLRYDHYRKLFCDTYGFRYDGDVTLRPEKRQMIGLCQNMMKTILSLGPGDAKNVAFSLKTGLTGDILTCDNQLNALYHVMEIDQYEKLHGLKTEDLFWLDNMDASMVLTRYTKLRFLLRRFEFDEISEDELREKLFEDRISSYAVEMVAGLCCVDAVKIRAAVCVNDKSRNDHEKKNSLEIHRQVNICKPNDIPPVNLTKYDKTDEVIHESSKHAIVQDHKICFIACTNDADALKECKLYIERLFVPEGYQTEFIAIEHAPSMTSGYNAGMSASDAKYKIYLHQDVYIINRWFLYDILLIFHSDDGVGMIGMMGTYKLGAEGVIWSQGAVGNPMQRSDLRRLQENVLHVDQSEEALREIFSTSGTSVIVDAADGFLLATQVDIPWRDDIFDGWDFYDCSQAMEMKRHGYVTVVPQMAMPWCMHDDGRVLNLIRFDHYRKRFLKEYKKELEHAKPTDAVKELVPLYEASEKRAPLITVRSKEFQEKINVRLTSQNVDEFLKLWQELSDKKFNFLRVGTQMYYQIMLILQAVDAEKNQNEAQTFIQCCHTADELFHKFEMTNYMLHRIELLDGEPQEEAYQWLYTHNISDTFCDVLLQSELMIFGDASMILKRIAEHKTAIEYPASQENAPSV